MATNPDTGKGEAYVTEETAPAVNSRELGALDAGRQLYKHEAICKEAFETHNDEKCMPRQIAAVLGLEFQEVCNMMETISQSFAQGRGCSPQDVYNFAEAYNYGMVCLHNKKPTLSRKGDPVLAFQVLGPHGYFQEAIYSKDCT